MTPPTQALVASHGGPSLELVISVWLDAKTRRSESARTAMAYRDTVANFRLYLAGLRTDVAPEGLDLDSDARAVGLAAQKWASQRSDGSGAVSAATNNLRLAILSSFYAFAAKRGLLTTPAGDPASNPIDTLERAQVHPYQGARALSAEQVAGRLAAINQSTLAGKRDFALLVLALSTGRRAAELRAVTRGDLEIEQLPQGGERVSVLWRRTKGGKSAQDELGGATAAALLTWLRAFYGSDLAKIPPTTPLFVSLSRNSSHGKQLSWNGLSWIWMTRLGTTKVHATRHTFAHALEEAGAKVSEIQAKLGHASLATTGRYLAALSDAANPYASLLEARWGIASTPRPTTAETTSSTSPPLRTEEHDFP